MSEDSQDRRGGDRGADAVGEHGAVSVAILTGGCAGEGQRGAGGPGDVAVGGAAIGAHLPLDGWRGIAGRGGSKGYRLAGRDRLVDWVPRHRGRELDGQ